MTSDSDLTQDERIKRASKKRRQQQKAETKQAILDAATALFLEHGYEGFSLRQVAVQIGYSPGTIYLYFGNKDDLLFTIADEGYQIFTNYLQEAVETSEHPREQIMAMGQAYIDFGRSYPVHYRLMFMERPDFLMHQLAELDDHSRWDASYQILVGSIERAMAAGIIEKADLYATADAIWAALHGVVALAIRMMSFDGERTENAINAAFKMIGRGMFSD
jgi:AcrR family transcriptional regulator